MLRALILLTLSGALLAGCEKIGSKDDPQEEVDHVMRLAQAPVATDDFLNKFSAIECKATPKNLCTAKGCEEGPVSVNQRYDIRKRTYQRQDARGVEQFQAKASSAGVWFNFEFPNPTMLFRVNTLGDFKEVVTLNDVVVVYSGSCQFR